MALWVVLAHAGHWLASLVYLAPVLIVVLAICVQTWRDRRRGVAEVDGRGDGADPADP